MLTPQCTASLLVLLGAVTLPLRTVTAPVPLRSHVDAARLQPRRDSFVVMMRGAPRGWQVLSVAREPNGWTLGDAITVDGMVAQSSAIRFDTSLNEVALRQEGTMMGKPMRIALDTKAGRVSGTALTPSNPSGELQIDVAATDGLLDDNAVTPLLAFVAWRDGLTVSFPVLASGKGTVAPWTARAVAMESITVPAGTFETWRVEVGMGASRMIANITRAAPHRIVKMSNGPMFEVLLVH